MTTTYSSLTDNCPRCCQPTGWCLPLCPRNVFHPDRTVTLPVSGYAEQHRLDGLSITGVMRTMEDPETAVEGRTDEPWAPMWTVVLVFLGMVLSGFWFARHSIAFMIWSLIHA